MILLSNIKENDKIQKRMEDGVNRPLSKEGVQLYSIRKFNNKLRYHLIGYNRNYICL